MEQGKSQIHEQEGVFLSTLSGATSSHMGGGRHDEQGRLIKLFHRACWAQMMYVNALEVALSGRCRYCATSTWTCLSGCDFSAYLVSGPYGELPSSSHPDLLWFFFFLSSVCHVMSEERGPSREDRCLFSLLRFLCPPWLQILPTSVCPGFS